MTLSGSSESRAVIRWVAYRTAAKWALPVVGFVGFTVWDAIRSRWAHRDEPPGIYNQRRRRRVPPRWG